MGYAASIFIELGEVLNGDDDAGVGGLLVEPRRFGRIGTDTKSGLIEPTQGRQRQGAAQVGRRPVPG